MPLSKFLNDGLASFSSSFMSSNCVGAEKLPSSWRWSGCRTLPKLWTSAESAQVSRASLGRWLPILSIRKFSGTTFWLIFNVPRRVHE